ncbi:MAG: complex I subunit 1 family protein [Sulfolobales archaeon]
MVPQYLVALLTAFLLALLVPLLDGVERKYVRARIQSRVGPPIIQTYYDLVKLFKKELLIPSTASKLFILAPPTSFFVGIAALFILPYSLSPSLGFEGDIILLAYLLVLSSLTSLLGGLASGNPFAEVSSNRELSLILASELFLGMGLAVIALKYGSLRLHTVSTNLILLPSVLLAYLTLLYYAFIKSVRTPYDIAEAEPEIASGYMIEYSGPLLAFLILGNLTRRLLVSSLFTVITFGPVISMATSPVNVEVLRYTLNAVLTISLSIIVYLSLGVVSVIHGRYRVIHALMSIKKYTLIPITALILAVIGF